MAAARRRCFKDVLTVMLHDDSSNSSSSDEEDLDLLFLDAAFGESRKLENRLDISELTEVQCEEMFRFEKGDMPRLLEALQIPVVYTGYQGSVFTGMEGLMIMLRRLSYPNRWCDLVYTFGRTEAELSIIFNTIIDDIYTRFNHLLSSLDLVWLDPALFANIIHQKGAPLDQCWGFIDGTARRIARPVRNQNVMYSGHKRIHCIKFQSVIAPNALIAHLFGPIEGKRHDAFMLGVSGLLPQLERMTKPNGEPYVVYGDPAYGISRHIISPFRGAHLTQLQQQFNRHMSEVRVCVEWEFGKISQYFAYLDFQKNLKVLLQPVAKYYAVGSLLTNCHTCLYGSVTSSFLIWILHHLKHTWPIGTRKYQYISISALQSLSLSIERGAAKPAHAIVALGPCTHVCSKIWICSCQPWFLEVSIYNYTPYATLLSYLFI